MPEAGVPYEAAEDLLTLDEIMRVVTILSSHGLTKVRLTGGEPLVRGRDVIELVKRISRIESITDLGLTTNAVLLAPIAAELYRQDYEESISAWIRFAGKGLPRCQNGQV